MYGIGNSTRCSVVTNTGRKSIKEGIDVCTCMTDSVCCTVELTQQCKESILQFKIKAVFVLRHPSCGPTGNSLQTGSAAGSEGLTGRSWTKHEGLTGRETISHNPLSDLVLRCTDPTACNVKGHLILAKQLAFLTESIFTQNLHMAPLALPKI